MLSHCHNKTSTFWCWFFNSVTKLFYDLRSNFRSCNWHILVRYFWHQKLSLNDSTKVTAGRQKAGQAGGETENPSRGMNVDHLQRVLNGRPDSSGLGPTTDRPTDSHIRQIQLFSSHNILLPSLYHYDIHGVTRVPQRHCCGGKLKEHWAEQACSSLIHR